MGERIQYWGHVLWNIYWRFQWGNVIGHRAAHETEVGGGEQLHT